MSANLQAWFTAPTGLMRWIMLLLLGAIVALTGGFFGLTKFWNATNFTVPSAIDNWLLIGTIVIIGIVSAFIGGIQLLRSLIAPYERLQDRELISLLAEYNQRNKGLKFVAIGGGTGLPASLRGMRQYTSNITAIVTVADDGGSSGRLRRDMGVPPPGDLRNNIAALADDDSILTQLFQYRFESGDLKGHAFGNLFIAALADIVQRQGADERSSLARALVEVERVLNIQGRVLPATLDDVNLIASVKLNGSNRTIKVKGESQIGDVNGVLETIAVEPALAVAYQPSIEAIRKADIVVIGPGSLYTSILPNLMVHGIADALRASDAYKIYVCNVAMQPVETDDYTVAEHITTLERHIGRGVFQAVIANNAFPDENAGENTRYVQAIPPHHDVLQRYEIIYTDLTDTERPWRHDTNKLAKAIMTLVGHTNTTN